MTAAPMVWEAQAEHRCDLRHDDVHRSWGPVGSFDQQLMKMLWVAGGKKMGGTLFRAHPQKYNLLGISVT